MGKVRSEGTIHNLYIILPSELHIPTKQLYMRSNIVCILLLVSLSASAQHNLIENSRERMVQMRTSHYALKDKLKAEHEAFKKEVMAKWGDKSIH